MAATADVLRLGPIQFDAFSTPDVLTVGGRQQMVVHRLPGGARVIDTLGRDDSDITWRGQFFGSNAYATAIQLEQLRIAGRVLPLTFGGQSRQVVIASFIYSLRRLPMWVEYVITLTVLQQGESAGADSSVLDSTTGSDMATAATAAGADEPWPGGPITPIVGAPGVGLDFPGLPSQAPGTGTGEVGTPIVTGGTGG